MWECVYSMFVPTIQCVRNNNLRAKLRVRPWSRKPPVKVRCPLIELNLFILTLLSLYCLEDADYVKMKHSLLCWLLTFGSRFPLFFYILFFAGFSLWVLLVAFNLKCSFSSVSVGCPVSFAFGTAFLSPGWRRQDSGFPTNTMTLVLNPFFLLTFPR